MIDITRRQLLVSASRATAGAIVSAVILPFWTDRKDIATYLNHPPKKYMPVHLYDGGKKILTRALGWQIEFPNEFGFKLVSDEMLLENCKALREHQGQLDTIGVELGEPFGTKRVSIGVSSVKLPLVGGNTLTISPWVVELV